MALTDPKRLIMLLEDLLQEMTRWSVMASDTLNVAYYEQRAMQEHVLQVSRHARIVNGQVIEDRLTYKSHRTDLDKLMSHCAESVQHATQALNQIRELRQRALNTLTEWQGQLQRANNWLSRAEQRVQKAESALDAAQSALQSAESRLSSLQSDLNRCKNSYTTDSQGRRHYNDCSGLERQVSEARQTVTTAQSRVESARTELKAAQDDRKRAQARVDCCKGAVQKATAGTETANRAFQYASDGLSTAERSLEHAHAAENALEMGRDKVEREEHEADLMLRDVQQAEDFADEANVYFLNAMRLEENAQRYHTMARADIHGRLHLLHLLNRPEMLGIAPYEITGGGGRQSPQRKTRSAIALPSVPQVSQEDDPTAEWITRMELVELDDLPLPTGIRDAFDFDKVPLEEMRDGLDRIQHMLPDLESGIGSNEEHWLARDEAEGLISTEGGYLHLYRVFYGAEAIEVTVIEESYHIQQGKHRIWLAKRMGIKVLPMRVTRQREYVPARKFQDTEGHSWQFRTYQGDNQLQVRLFDLNKRAAIPDVLDQGDAGYADIVLEDELGLKTACLNTFEITTFDQTRGLDVQILDQAERASRASGAASIYFHVTRAQSQDVVLREWYRKQGYIFRRQTQNTLVYKNFSIL